MRHEDDQDGEEVKSWNEIYSDIEKTFRKLAEEIFKIFKPVLDRIVKIIGWFVEVYMIMPEDNNKRRHRGLPYRRRYRGK